MSRLILFTNSFPYDKGEEFLETEITYLSKYFDRIVIAPLSVVNIKNKRILPENVEVLKPLLANTFNQKLLIIISGIFNTSPLFFAFHEFFKKNVFINKIRLYCFLSSTFILRSSLSSKAYKDLCNLIKEDDALYFYWGDNSANLAPFIRKKFSNKIIIRFHGGDIYEENKANYLPYRKALFASIDLAVLVSEHGKNYLINKYPEIKKKVIVSRLGTIFHSLPTIQKESNKLHIVTCSILVALKRIHLLAEALPLLEFPIKWTHFGDGPLMDEINKIISQYPSHIETYFPGYLSNNEIFKYYEENYVDVLMNVSETEGLPVSFMEAFSMGIPVIATDVGGVSEIVNDSNGILINPDIKIDELAKCIKRFYAIEDKNIFRKNARKTWEDKFNAEKNYNEFSILLKNFVDS